ncbi:hypothetical protein K443DRAFT_680254 [Laccaria amethystina LaAM-08-1]|uniref:Uncharacterized protein n=1 Tax=Laccaria amethystina LaAM-08-1 TaxID=1095629 RepID=A0A0C9WNH2_9AGAR|nr:hypothetical protein K443DRAFT_680254 [Laccaria amethystina LaAM-08-1]
MRESGTRLVVNTITQRWRLVTETDQCRDGNYQTALVTISRDESGKSPTSTVHQSDKIHSRH